MSKTIANVTVGEPQTKQDAPAHVKGVAEGNEPGSLAKAAGFVVRGKKVRGTARRSTGINAERRDPIDPKMPNLSPA